MNFHIIFMHSILQLSSNNLDFELKAIIAVAFISLDDNCGEDECSGDHDDPEDLLDDPRRRDPVREPVKGGARAVAGRVLCDYCSPLGKGRPLPLYSHHCG